MSHIEAPGIPEPTTHNPKPVESFLRPAQLLKQDEYDRFSKKWNTAVGLSAVGMLGTLYAFQQFTDSHHLQSMQTFFNEWGIGMSGVGYGAKIPYEWYKGRKKMKEENSRGLIEEYSSFGRVVYKGHELLEVGDVTLKKGDNIFCVALPTIRNKDGSDLTSEQQQAASLYYLQTLQDMKVVFSYYGKNRPYQAAAVSFPQIPPMIQRKTPEAIVDQETIVRGKNIVPRDTDAQVVFLKIEDLEALTKTSFSLLKEAVEALENETATLLFEKAQKADTTEERKKAADELQAHVYRLLEHNLVASRSGPSARLERVDHNPLRRKIYNSAQLRTYFLKNMEGVVRPEIYIQFTEENKPVTQKKAEDFLGITEASLDEVLQQDDTDGLKKGKLSYKIWDLLRTDDMSLFDDKPLSEEDMRKKLGNVDIIPPRRYPLMDKAQTSKKKLKSLNNWVTPILLAGVLSAGAGIAKPKVEEVLAGNITNIPKVFQDVRSRFYGQEDNKYDNFEHNSVKFPTEVPKNIPDWGIRHYKADGELDVSAESDKITAGYYIAATSNKVGSNGEWKPVTQRLHELHLPESVTGREYSEVDKWVHFDAFERSKSIKIPIQAGRKVGAIKVQGIESLDAKDFTAISFQAYELVDGTVELVVPRGLTSPIIGFKVTAHEIEAQDGEGVHATQPIEPVDESQLNQKAEELLKKAEAFSQGYKVSIDVALADVIRSEFTYSINPPNAHAIEGAHTPLEQINAIASGESCDCDVCNTLAVHLAALRPKADDTTTNMAFGYLLGTNTHGSASKNVSWLVRSASHGFQIDQKGRVVDATAIVEANDQLTKDYLKSLSNTPTIDWSEIINRFYDDAERNFADAQDKKYLYALGLILGGTASLFILKGGKKMIDRYGNHETLRGLGDQAILKLYSPQDLRYAYQIFSEASWNESSTTGPVAVDGEQGDGQELLTRLRENINFERVADYLSRDTDATDYESFKVRVLGNYLINS